MGAKKISIICLAPTTALELVKHELGHFLSCCKAAPPAAEMLDDWHGVSLGTNAEVRQRISACVPDVDWSNLAWGIFDGNGFSYEFNLGVKELNVAFMVHVRGGGDAVNPLLRIADATDWYLLDCLQGEWLHHCSSPDKGWEGFQAYRDRVFGKLTRG